MNLNTISKARPKTEMGDSLMLKHCIFEPAAIEKSNNHPTLPYTIYPDMVVVFIYLRKVCHYPTD
jgi:hypothetical protein